MLASPFCLPIPSWTPLAGRPQCDELGHGLGDRAVACDPPSHCAGVHLEPSGGLHLANRDTLEMSLEL
jgi:hypothetical protein